MSQNKSYNKYKTHSRDECAENMVKKLLAIPKHLNIDKKKRCDVRPEKEKFPHETFNMAEPQIKCQNFCLCSYENIWDSEKKITKLKILKKCDHCNRHHELCLNYNSENNSSLWANMMDFFLKWNKQQNLDDENQEATHNIES